ncbi:hypothetical protein SCLCIDRAFT_1219854 [Scleroderma citrinum Foug A]|uniref:Uncharacterized protein n=1 Tax=Scleroderma citrinum Foug A TaxID=1036808 RepID=A0A0C2ZX28_9AGAM|nr:hypothetical protein SCLCIDRAFT_1219854 [Scleroderma citrinum Foug A]
MPSNRSCTTWLTTKNSALQSSFLTSQQKTRRVHRKNSGPGRALASSVLTPVTPLPHPQTQLPGLAVHNVCCPHLAPAEIEGFNFSLFKRSLCPAFPCRAAHTRSHGHITVEYDGPVSVSVNALTTHVISYLTASSHALSEDGFGLCQRVRRDFDGNAQWIPPIKP